MDDKTISVVMGCKNSNGELLQASLNSILYQTYQDFEIIIVDDGSNEPLESLVRSITSDTRVKVFTNPASGLGAALNYGVQQSVGKYIARLDDDDLMSCDRLLKQKVFLDSHPEVSCVGSHRYSFYKENCLKHHKFPLEHEDIVKSLLSLKFSMAHSALMFRRESFNKIGGYRIAGCGQDLDFILQMGLVGKLANIDDYLMYYYVTMGSLSAVSTRSRLKAYLYALQSISQCGDYPQYVDLVSHSIAKLDRTIETKKVNINIKKRMLIALIRVFGKKIPHVL